MILAGRPHNDPLRNGATIGAVEQTIHSRAAERMSGKYNIKFKKTFQELMLSLRFSDLDFLITDRPMIENVDGVFEVKHLLTEQSLEEFYREEIGYDLGHAIAFRERAFCREIDSLLLKLNERDKVGKPLVVISKSSSPC